MHPVVVILIIMGIGWAVFWAVWLVAAFTAKASRGRWNRFSVLRIGVVVVVTFLVRLTLSGGRHETGVSPNLAGIGLVLWVAGLGLAVWARLYIGRNWGMPMTRREEPDLITTGPYRFIRHPIYSGLILAFIGTALAITPVGLIAVAVLAAFFIFSASREERFLAQEFPDAFPAYKARTKLLIPLVF